MRLQSMIIAGLGVMLSAQQAWSQVTLISQNRFVSAGSVYNPPECMRSTTIPANGFTDFVQDLTVQCLGANLGRAVQNSTLSPTGFSVQMSVTASGNAPFSTSFADSGYEVVFDVVQPVPYTSTNNTLNDGQLRLVGPGIDRILEDSEDGVLRPGRYTLSCTIRARSPGGDGFSRVENMMTFGQMLPDFSIDWFTIDNGGGELSGGAFELNGTIGQYDARGLLAGGNLAINSGYWSAFEVFCPADFNRDGSVDFFDYLDFVQAFDSEDPTADFNGDNTVDFFDYLDFVAAFDATC